MASNNQSTIDSWQEAQRREANELKAWLSSLQAHDVVAIHDGWNARLSSVDRVTPARIVVSGVHYRKDTGRKVGSMSYRASRLIVPTNEVMAEVTRRSRIATLGDIKWALESDAVLDAVMTALAVARTARGDNHGIE